MSTNQSSDMGILRRILGTALLLSVGGVLGWFGQQYYHTYTEYLEYSGSMERHQGGGIYTNPLLECASEHATLNQNIIPFRPEVQAYITRALMGEDISDIAYYFRDLNNGPWIGINEKDGFLPASLLKVPLAMAYYKAAEVDPSILSKRLTYTKEWESPPSSTQIFAPRHELELGKSYTVEELLELMLVESSNDPVKLLYDNIDAAYILGVYEHLGVDESVLFNGTVNLSAKNYATFFRILYNASYLNPAGSEKVLELLSKTNFDQGIVLGVPKGTEVSHKFGERGSTAVQQQIHDCGIVYYPKHPYLVCVMTRGTSVDALLKAIGDISNITYEEVTKQFEEGGIE